MFRSSLRKPQSPRSAIADHSEAAGTAAYCGPTMAGASRSPAAAGDSASRRSAEGVLKSRGGLKRESSFVRQKSNLTLTSGRASAPSSATRQSAAAAAATSVQKSAEAAKKSPAVISSGSGYGSPPPSLLTAMNNNNNSPRKTIPTPMERNAAALAANPQGRVFASMSERTSCATAAAAGVRGSPLVLSSGTFNRRLTATLSPEECKMMFTHTEKVSKSALFYS
jgi:hypothetical protein